LILRWIFLNLVGNHFFSADSFFFNKENFFPVTLKKLPINRLPIKRVCQGTTNQYFLTDTKGSLPADAIPGDLATQDCILGMEVSGLDEMGKRVMGLVPAKVSLINNFSVVYFIHNCISTCVAKSPGIASAGSLPVASMTSLKLSAA
jgi:hypothetical protein